MGRSEMEPKDRIIVALDVDSVGKARNLVVQLAPYVGGFKVGLELINSMIASIIIPESLDEALDNATEIRMLFTPEWRKKIFWDQKIHDIPNTLAGASRPLSKMGVKIFNFHASAGREAIIKVVENKGDSLVFGVTVLTTITPEECKSIFGDYPGEKVLQFARMLVDAGADGIICSPQELRLLGENDIKLLKGTPGVRPLWYPAKDQKRVMTPQEAVKAKADFVIIGRPITDPPPEIGSPVDAAKKVAEEIAAVM